jgi:excisionase family DNA binding protein
MEKKEHYLRVKGVAQYTKLSEKTIRSYIQQRKIPYIKVNKSILFDVTKIDEWINSFPSYSVIEGGN